MNQKLGKFGRQEGIALVALSSASGGFFAVDNARIYQNGNVAYLAMMLAMLLTAVLTELVLWRMQRLGCQTLPELFCRVFPKIGKGLGLSLLPILLLGAALPLLQFLAALTQYIYVDFEYVNISLYFLPALLVLVLLGMETLARTARLLLPAVLAFTVFGLLTAIPAYQTFRLYPLPGKPVHLLSQALSMVLCFLPATLVLLCGGTALQGIRNVRFCCRTGLLIGGGISTLMRFCLGLSYSYADLRTISAPLYRLVMEVRTENPTLRADRVTMFVWIIGGLIAAAYCLHGASLLFISACQVRDIRPVGVLLVQTTVLIVLLLHCTLSRSIRGLQWVYANGGWFGIIPLSGLLLGSLFGKERTVCAAC